MSFHSPYQSLKTIIVVEETQPKSQEHEYKQNNDNKKKKQYLETVSLEEFLGEKVDLSKKEEIECKTKV